MGFAEAGCTVVAKADGVAASRRIPLRTIARNGSGGGVVKLTAETAAQTEISIINGFGRDGR